MFKNLGSCLFRFCSMAVLAVGCGAVSGAVASASEPHYRYSGHYYRNSVSHASHWGAYSKSSSYYSAKKGSACGSYYGGHSSNHSPHRQHASYPIKQKYSRGY